jgi:CubicO group peptidase (beta-lactamase class C family)
VRWNEDGWHGLFSDSHRLGEQVRAGRKSVLKFAQGYRQSHAGKKTFNYSGLDAAVAALAAEKILGNEKLTTFLQAGLWASIGAESDASWGVDNKKTAIGSCCLKMTVRDLARFGVLVLHKGRSARGQAIPRAWFDLATTYHPDIDDIPRRRSGDEESCRLAYRFFWWLRPGRKDFTGVGIAGQFLHIYPSDDTVIVQISDWGDWKNGDYLECETLSAHDALAAAAK